MSDPDHGALVEVPADVQGAVRSDGPVIVVTAMSLPRAAREALAHRLGPGHIVRDIRDAGTTADVVLVPPVSAQLVGSLRSMFPGAKVLVAELSDAEFGLDVSGPVSRIIDSGVDGYFVAPDLGRLAAATREVAAGGSPPALTAGQRSALGELAAPAERPDGPALHLAGSAAPFLGRQPRCVILDIDAWVEQLDREGSQPPDRSRCTELAWTIALQVLASGVDVVAVGVDRDQWQQRAHEWGVRVLDDR